MGYSCHPKYFRIIPFTLEVELHQPLMQKCISFLEMQMFLEVLARNQEYDKGRRMSQCYHIF